MKEVCCTTGVSFFLIGAMQVKFLTVHVQPLSIIKTFFSNSEFNFKALKLFLPKLKVTLTPDNWLHLFVAVSEHCSKWA